MRISRILLTGLALVSVSSAIADAQAGRQFRNSWFWGLKGGAAAYADLTPDPTVAPGGYRHTPMVGVEWLITRSRGGLYVSAAQGFQTQQTFIANSASPNDTSIRLVDLNSVRRLDMALMAFPGGERRVTFHPYVGLGFTFQTVSAAPVGPFANATELEFADAVVQQAKTSATPVAILGAQYRFRALSVFGQLTGGPSDRNWILYNGRSATFSYEIGVRYNVGTSIDR
jgi:hypothetical protein